VQRLRTLILIFLFLIMGVLAPVQIQAEEVCIPINTKAEGKFTGPTTTASQITGGGILHGTTTAVEEITGEIAPGIKTCESILVLTTQHGTLTLFFSRGVFNLVTGEFSGDSSVSGGT
jgi:hypothetical protein